MPPVRRPVRQSLAKQVRESMETLIREGEWVVGERIPAENSLTELFGVSHNTVREAVQGLIHAGLLVARPGDGTYVTATDRLDAALDDRLHRADTARILEARLAVEQAVTALAARNRTPDDLAAMRAALATCKTRRGRGIEDDMAFHACVADATHNPILSQIYRVLAGYLSRHFTAALSERQYDPAALALHDELLAALEAGDADAATHAVAQIVAFDTENIRETPQAHRA
ncbi:MAG: FadR/GntR family transcriptional regulator [Akkermansia sp.]